MHDTITFNVLLLLLHTLPHMRITILKLLVNFNF